MHVFFILFLVAVVWGTEERVRGVYEKADYKAFKVSSTQKFKMSIKKKTNGTQALNFHQKIFSGFFGGFIDALLNLPKIIMLCDMLLIYFTFQSLLPPSPC